MEACTNHMKTDIDLSSANILSLDDDCLLEIFNQLAELCSQVRLAMQSSRLGSIFQFYCKRRFRALNKDELNGLTRSEMEYFFAVAGATVKELNYFPQEESEQFDYANWVNEFCTNVRKINFSHTKIKSKCLRRVLVNMRQITSLELSHCSLDDNAMLGVAELSTLECLKLVGELNVTGCHLHKLTNLVELTFVECDLKNKYLIKICKSSPNLEKLVLMWCNLLTNELIAGLPKYCLELQSLKICALQRLQYTPIALLPQLRNLELADEYSHAHASLLADLASHKSDQLERLRLHSRTLLIGEHLETLVQLKQLKLVSFDCSKYLNPACLESLCRLKHLETISMRYCNLITDGAVLSLLKGCTTLKYVNVMYCEQLSARLVYDAIELLREQLSLKEREFWQLPVFMLIAGTQIDKSILEDPAYLAAARLLNLSFIQPFKNACENRYPDFMPTFGALNYFYGS